MAGAGPRRLSGGEITLIVVVAALVLTFGVMLAQRLTSGDPGSQAETPTSPGPTAEGTTSAPPTEEPTDDPGEDLSGLTYSFVSPSGNIACAMEPDRVVCGIGTFQYEVPDDVAEGCDGNAGHFLAVTEQDSRLLCDTSGPEPSFDLEGVETLEYGRELERGAFTCSSERNGVTCSHSDTGRSIFVSRADHTLD